MVKRGSGRVTVPGHMPPVLADGEQLGMVLKLALGRATDSPARHDVLDLALKKAGVAALPSTAGALAAFVFGPFRETIDERLGSEVGAKVTSSLLPMLTNQAAQEPIIDEAQDAAKAVGTEAEIPTVESRTVVLADGDAASRSHTTALLRSLGHEVIPVPDGHVALAVCIRRRPALVIAAASTPAVDPVELAALLTVAFAAEAPPVVAVVDGDLDGSEPGIAAVLVRPCDEGQLAEIVESLLPAA